MAPALDLDVSLYLVTDSALLRGRRLADVVAAGIRGGVTCVQLRDKAADHAELLALARALLAEGRLAADQSREDTQS